MVMSESNLAAAIHASPNMSRRIEAIVRNAWWNDTTNNDPRAAIPLDQLLWAVASKDTIRTTIRDAGIAAGEANVDTAVDAVTDAALWAVINPALTWIKTHP